jgi:hypothetical protein
MELINVLWAKHGAWLIPLLWLVASLILNVAFRKRTPEEWVEYGKKNPRMAAVIRLISALGIDPAKALIAIKRLVDGQAQKTEIAKKVEEVAEVVKEVAADPPKELDKSEEKKDDPQDKSEKKETPKDEEKKS